MTDENQNSGGIQFFSEEEHHAQMGNTPVPEPSLRIEHSEPKKEEPSEDIASETEVKKEEVAAPEPSSEEEKFSMKKLLETDVVDIMQTDVKELGKLGMKDEKKEVIREATPPPPPPAPAPRPRAPTPFASPDPEKPPRKPIVFTPNPMILKLLEYARKSYGSDLHIAADRTPKMRLFGEIQEIPEVGDLKEEEILQMIFTTMDEETRYSFEEDQDVDYSFCDDNGNRYRCNAMKTLSGSAAVFRIISNKILSFEELGLPESVRRVQDYKKGMVLVTGPSGCGKSTTLATLVDMINQVDEGHILTIEDPVEILHTSKKSLVNHREVKTHTKSFARALKSALREDPDCIMIGEMRDYETVSLALTAAETGHIVFGTLHTSSAVKTITRIIDVFPSNEQEQVRAMLAESIQCVISQVLVKRKDGKGQVAAFEVMYGTPAIRSLIRASKEFQISSAIEVGMKDGMQTIDQSLQKLVAKGIVDVEDAKRLAKRPEDFE